jgi:uncharacterized protein YchJ
MKITGEELWDLYMSDDGVIENFDAIYDFFLDEIPPEFSEEYDVGEIILETKGHNESDKNFDRVLKFTSMLQDKQPELYKENFQYFDDFLIDYHLFKHDGNEAEKAFSNFINHPDQDFDALSLSLKKLLFYQHTEIVDKTVIQIYEEVSNSEKLIGGAESELAMYKFYINMEHFFSKADKDSLNNELFKSLQPFGFELKGNSFSFIEDGLYNSEKDCEIIIKKFTLNRKSFMLSLQSQFLVEMAKKEFSFVLSGTLWDNMLRLWEEQANNKKQVPDKYFYVNIDGFDKYLRDLGGNYFSDNKSEMMATLWFSVYIYDFLLSIGLIQQSTYDAFNGVCKTVKGRVIAGRATELWNSNFIHSWVKPDSVSENEFEAEKAIFEKSISIKSDNILNFKRNISDELESMGEFADFIQQGADYNEHKLDFMSNNFFEKGTPIKVEQKVGRNDPCTCGSGKKFKKCCGK